MSKVTARPVGIAGGVRIPFCRSNTAYATASNKDMMIHALKGLVDKYGLHGQALGDVSLGAVIKHSADWNMARECVLSSGLSADTPAFDLQQACGTGLDAAILMGNKIALGQIESGIAGGVDTTSDAPIVFKRRFAQRLIKLSNARNWQQRLGALKGFSFGDLAPVPPSTAEPRTRLSMGESCELMVKRWKIAREDQDQLAYESHVKAAKAYEEGFFDDLVIPFQGVTVDNNLRPDVSLEKLGSLRPCFDKTPFGTLTAGNSTPLTDGAACTLLGSDEWLQAQGLSAQAYLTHSQVAAVNFMTEEGLLMAPAYAVPKLLAQAGISLQDFDFYEIHEAFAGQVLCTLSAWEDATFCKDKLGLDKPLGSIDRSKMNVKGSSLAAGHPFAATGARIIAVLAKLLEQKGKGRGLISICTAGGMGVTAILERP